MTAISGSIFRVLSDGLKCTADLIRDPSGEKIRRIVDQVGFYPFVFNNTPNFLRITPYFKKDELAELLQGKLVIGEPNKRHKDQWDTVNVFRSYVQPAVNASVSEILKKYTATRFPGVEIGCGKGYHLSDDVSVNMIRIQPSLAECELFKQESSAPIYHVSIEEFCRSCQSQGKTIPLFWALDVFDTQSSSKRKEIFAQIATLQNRGDRILILLDTNPFLDTLVEEVERCHLGCKALPYFPLEGNQYKASFIMVPESEAPENFSLKDFLAIIEREAQSLTSQYKQKLDILRQRGYQILFWEDFFADQVQEELKNTGYKSRKYYHASFQVVSSSKYPNISQEIIYKAVADTATIRQWHSKDSNFKDMLAAKGLQAPDIPFNATINKIVGAELLIIEAEKIT